jgi:hypothetical protein
MKFKKIVGILFCAMLLCVPSFVRAEEETEGTSNPDQNEARVYFFHGETCQYCQKALAFFDSIEGEYGDKFELVKYEVWGNTENASLMKKVEKYLKVTAGGVPFYIIGDQVFAEGYSDSLNDKIIAAIEKEYAATEKTNVIEDTLANDNVEEEEGNVLDSIIIVAIIGAAIGAVVYARGKNKKK